ncbi:MAG: hydantoinase/oxoprolinase family protein, partial [Angelakisella sp.]
TQRNLVRAIAVGATEMRSKNMLNRRLSEKELRAIIAENLEVKPSEPKIAAQNGVMTAFTCERVEKKFFGLSKKVKNALRLIDEEGIIRLQKNNAWVVEATVENWQQQAAFLLEELTEYNDGGTQMPNIYVVLGKRIIDLSGMQNDNQIYSLGNVELAGCGKDEPLILAATRRTDS